jgi:hypothetical protein
LNDAAPFAARNPVVEPAACVELAEVKPMQRFEPKKADK